MTTGQAPIRIKEQGSLDLSGVGSNIGTNRNLAAASNVNGQDIYPLSVTTDHLYAQGATIYGALKSGTIFVGSGGVIVSSDADGATPTTGIIISSSQIILKNSGVDVVTLDGTDGSFTLQSAASGQRLVLNASSLTCYDSDSDASVIVKDGSGVQIANNSVGAPGSLERVSFGTSSGDTFTESAYIGYDATYTGLAMAQLHPTDSDADSAFYFNPWALGGGPYGMNAYLDLNKTGGTNYFYVQGASMVVDGTLDASNFPDSVSTLDFLAISASGSMTCSSTTIHQKDFSKIGPWIHLDIAFVTTLGGTASGSIILSPLEYNAASASGLGYTTGYVWIINNGSYSIGRWTGDGSNADRIIVQLVNGANFALGVTYVRLQGMYRWA